MTDALKKQVADWQTACKHIDDLVKKCPPLSDMEVLHDWFGEVHGWVVYLATEQARAETYYSIAYMEVLDTPNGISDNALQLIRKSSTLTDQYMRGKIPELYQAWQRLRNTAKAVDTILSDMRTNIVTLREADKRESMQAPAQR